MTSTPSLLNRILIGLLGLKLLAVGVLLLLLASVPEKNSGLLRLILAFSGTAITSNVPPVSRMPCIRPKSIPVPSFDSFALL